MPKCRLKRLLKLISELNKKTKGSKTTSYWKPSFPKQKQNKKRRKVKWGSKRKNTKVETNGSNPPETKGNNTIVKCSKNNTNRNSFNLKRFSVSFRWIWAIRFHFRNVFSFLLFCFYFLNWLFSSDFLIILELGFLQLVTFEPLVFYLAHWLFKLLIFISRFL